MIDARASSKAPLGWEPKIGFEHGLRTTIEWFRGWRDDRVRAASQQAEPDDA